MVTKDNVFCIKRIVEDVLNCQVNAYTVLVHKTAGHLTQRTIRELSNLYEIFNRIEDEFKIRIPLSFSVVTFQELITEINGLV